eukprot:CAMPEP_0117046714 /NCGR_PEP_ID=MMETSP0472-20121206/32295_1 /TAXON_ID=693140 ORGANISM="Tiarina fusus, Strain LIS" /NCGR_SAMPLE_ID=MMETSP0472 /ASSEMBLY_ACC=CAM_ASM_000603 /LENGTH=481 /DNA_ID=CAMNT_0004759161 /DNA_START=11 /DNA_END=1456 /DNA_ORIENTATION=+
MTTKEKIDRVHIFSQYFESGSGIQFAKNQALAGTLQHSALRSLCWRLFLKIIPEGTDASTWKGLIKQQRISYNQLKEEYLINPYEETDESENLLVNNPLSQVEDSPWQTYFQNKELQNEILQDIVRTYPEKEFFQEEKVRNMMLNILFIVAKRNPTTGYRQGMHELLAPIIYLLHKESVPVGELQDHVAYLASSEEYIEHDAFIIFDTLMVHMDQWFVRTSSTMRGSRSTLNDGNSLDNTSSSPIVQKCKKVQDIMLKKIDPILHSFLTDMGIEPQIYALRWIRLLFGREFHLDDVLTIWDAIFAFGDELKLVEYICLAMVLYLRDQLLEMDNSGCLRRLLNYPPVEDVTIFITSAIHLADPTGNAVKTLNTSNSSVKAKPKTKPQPVSANISELFSPNEDTTSQVVTSSNPMERLTEKLKQSQTTRVHMANRLERIIYVLHQGILEDKAIDPETLIVTVAELKQVKDILNGLLDAEPLNS